MTVRPIARKAAVLFFGCLCLLTGGCVSQVGSSVPSAPKQEAAATEAKPAPKQEAAATETKPAPKQEAAAPEAKPAPKQETAATEKKNAAAPYVTAADDFGNLATGDPSLPVYDRYT